MNFLDLQSSPKHELMNIHSKKLYGNESANSFKGRTYSALNVIGHGLKIAIKPVVYLIASLAMLALALYHYFKGQRSSIELKKSAKCFVCIFLSPFAEALKTCQAILGVISPTLYYSKFKATAQLGTTYTSEVDGNLDYSHVNAKLGYGFVLDGCGHNNPDRKAIQTPLIEAFIRSYEDQFTTFKDLESAKKFVQEQLNAFGKCFNEKLADYAPALLFAQVVKIGDKRYLLKAHMSDTALYIKSNDCWYATTTGKDIGFGSNGTRRGEINLPTVEVREVLQGDQLVAFTDGIGEFLYQKECIEILNSCKDSAFLLENFKQKIMQKDRRLETSGSQITANGGNIMKLHSSDLRNSSNYDDISLFTLLVE